MLHSREATRSEIEKTGLFHRVYLPEGHQSGDGVRRPLVLFVHGRAGNARVMWIFSKALEGIKPIIVAPQAPIEDPIGGFSWWNVTHPANAESPLPKNTKEEELNAPLILLQDFLNACCDLYGGDRTRLYAAGFSQGAACVGSMSVRNPGLFKGVALLSGFLPRIVQTGLSTNPVNLSACRYFIAHGINDEVIPFGRAQETSELLTRCGSTVEFHSEDVGHKTGSAGIKALRVWFEANLR